MLQRNAKKGGREVKSGGKKCRDTSGGESDQYRNRGGERQLNPLQGQFHYSGNIHDLTNNKKGRERAGREKSMTSKSGVK